MRRNGLKYHILVSWIKKIFLIDLKTLHFAVFFKCNHLKVEYFDITRRIYACFHEKRLIVTLVKSTNITSEKGI